MTHDDDSCLAWNGFKLMEGSEDEDCSLSETGFGLAEDVDTEESLRNTCLLDCDERRC